LVLPPARAARRAVLFAAGCFAVFLNALSYAIRKKKGKRREINKISFKFG
jgi:hypothetical protein